MAEEVVQPGRNINMHDSAPSETTASAVSARASTLGRVITASIDGLWRLLRRPGLLVLLAVMLFALLVAARYTAQMPGQLLESPAEATRWVNSVAANWGGIGGQLARTLQLYDLFHAQWFAILVAVTALFAAVQLADAIGRLQSWRTLPRVLLASSGDALDLSASETVTRQRFALEVAPGEAVTRVRAAVEATLVAPREMSSDTSTPEGGKSDAAQDDAPETRMLATRNGWSAWLRILLPAAALIGALLVWVNMVWSWQVQTETLTPGATLELPTHNLTLTNPAGDVEEESDAVRATIGGAEVQIPADGSAVRAFGMIFSARRSSPALIIAAEKAILALPGAPQPRESVAVTFPVAGAEQFVVLPGEGIGIRLVRVGEGAENGFLAEVYAEQAVQPIASERIEGAGEVEIPLEEETLLLTLTPSWSVNVTAERGYASWTWLPLLLLALAGCVALLRPATFLAAQISQWEEKRALVVLQGNDRAQVTRLREALETNEQL